MSDQPLKEFKESIEYLLIIKQPRRLFLVSFIAFFGWLLAQNAWISDDAFISMRVVDNFIHGNGLVWNVGERVQVFTHPLWLMLVTLTNLIFGDPYKTLFWLSYIVSFLSVILVLINFTRTYKSVILVGITLAGSMAFIDYSSSGLENPLTHLLLVLLLINVLKRPLTIKTFFITSLISSLACVNRLDTILFYLPIMCYQFYLLRAQWTKSLGILFLAFIPLLAWELFSTFYYGFPFPNTFYAKIAVDLTPEWLHDHGWNYFVNSLRWDPLTIATISTSLFFVIWERDWQKIMISLGVVCYLSYLYQIGGDFMSGRFLSGAFLVSVVLLADVDFNFLFKQMGQREYVFALACVLFLGLAADYPPTFIKQTDGATISELHVSNEKLIHFGANSWYNHNQKAVHQWAQDGLNFRKTGEKFTSVISIGLFGYYAGSDVYLMDKLALADPFLARLPITEGDTIGHLTHYVPLGYEDTLKSGFVNQIVNPDLHLYYDKLSILIHKDLFEPGRMQEILNFNLGRYDYLVNRFDMASEQK